MANDYLFKKLKQILLEEERSDQLKVVERLNQIDAKIEEREQLEPKVNPIIEDKVVYLQENFSTVFGPEVTKSIRKQIQESQDEVVEALYPIIGKMIKKYIVKEFELLSDRVDQQIDRAFSLDGWIRRIKSWLGIKQDAVRLDETLLQPQIEQILVIQKDSGLIIGSYSQNPSVDNDMVAGMITAIKTFAQDAFNKDAQDLEMIEYETFKLF
ncbi:MAG: cell envelope biogenesis protein OmpA, partial [Bacteroidota bacterium]